MVLWYTYIMEIVKEITIWDCGYKVCNHTYLLSKSNKVLAYADERNGEIIKLKSQFVLDKRYRKFESVKHAGLSKIAKTFTEEVPVKNTPIKPTENIRVFNVKSKDKVYTVTFNKNSKQVVCGCIGFNYRRYCKHSDAVSKQLGIK